MHGCAGVRAPSARARALSRAPLEARDTPPSTALVVAAFAAVYVLWGSTYVAIAFAIETLPPFFMAGVRFVIAGGILWTWARLRGAPAPVKLHWRSAAIVGALMLVGGNGGVVWAESRIPSSLAALIVATTPLWMALIDGLRPGGTRPSARTIVGLFVGFAGVVLLIGPENLIGQAGAHAPDLAGALVVVGASLSWAAGSLYSRHAPLPRQPLLATGIEMFAGGLFMLVLGVATGELGDFAPGAVSARSAWAFVYLIIAGSLIGFTAYVWLLRVTTPARASTYAYVNPVVAVFLGWALASEPVSARVLAAAAVIILAVVIITTARRTT